MAGGRSPAADFFVDYFTSALSWDEVLVAVRVPKLGAGWGYDYQKFHRTAQSWAIVGVAAAVRRDNGSIAEARVALTNMGADADAGVVGGGRAGGCGRLGGGGRRGRASAADGTHPTSELHAQADYREHLARVLIQAGGARRRRASAEHGAGDCTAAVWRPDRLHACSTGGLRPGAVALRGWPTAPRWHTHPRRGRVDHRRTRAPGSQM